MIAAMDMGYVSFALNLLVAALLVATIAYAWTLNRKLNALRESKQDMEQLIARFAQATSRAENGLAEIRQTADQTGGELRQSISEGRSIADDLVFLVERAGKLADRLTVPPARAGAALDAAAEAPDDPIEPGLVPPDRRSSKLHGLR